jgi:hypothetical protein
MRKIATFAFEYLMLQAKASKQSMNPTLAPWRLMQTGMSPIPFVTLPNTITMLLWIIEIFLPVRSSATSGCGTEIPYRTTRLGGLGKLCDVNLKGQRRNLSRSCQLYAKPCEMGTAEPTAKWKRE